MSRDTPHGASVVVELPLASIRPNIHQPRRTFDPVALQELATSIAAHGRVLQPVLVRPAADASQGQARFELVSGERRWRASALAQLPTIRAIVEGVDNATSSEMALTENMARDDLNPIEEARGCATLRDDFGLSVAEIARRVGRSRTAISHLIRLLDLPDPALEHIANNVLTEGHGRVLLRLDGHGDRITFAKRCVKAGWSVRELERQVDARYRHVGSQPPASSADEEAALQALAERLTPMFGPSPVQIVPCRHGRYELQVGFHDLTALTSGIARLCDSDGATK